MHRLGRLRQPVAEDEAVQRSEDQPLGATRRGGDGALREFSDALLASQGWMEGFESSGVGTTN
jgi:3-deoxy-D-manno-octulosonate 8-phosphate phosphatase KdsC-like HAD superfamily phosphatase